jgi:hypothetical protein
MTPSFRPLLAVSWLVAAWSAAAAEGLPGSTWGELPGQFPQPGDSDAVLQGWIRQGVALTRWEAGKARFLLDAYATVRYGADSSGLQWNNYVGPGGGLMVDMSLPDGPLISVGLEYVHQWNYRPPAAQPYAAAFTNWYHWWYVGRRDFPGSTWGDLRWQVPLSGLDDLVLQGWIRQGAVLDRWEWGPQRFALVPYLRVRYDADTRGLSWKNAVGPGAGIALEMDRPNGPQLSFGTEYGWEKNLWSGGAVHRVDVFMRWYGWWDLR